MLIIVLNGTASRIRGTGKAKVRARAKEEPACEREEFFGLHNRCSSLSHRIESAQWAEQTKREELNTPMPGE